MPLINLDHMPIRVSCEHCGNEVTSTIGDVEHDHHVTCPVCGKVTHFTLEEADRHAHEADSKGGVDDRR